MPALTTQAPSAPASFNEIPAAWAQVLDSVTSTTLNSEAARTFWSRHALSSFGPHRSTPPSTLGQDTDSVRVPQNNQYRQLVEQGLNYVLLIQCVSDRALVALLRALDSPDPNLVAIRAAASAVASATATVGAYAEWYELTHVVYPGRPVHSILSLDDVDYARRRLRQRLLQPASASIDEDALLEKLKRAAKLGEFARASAKQPQDQQQQQKRKQQQDQQPAASSSTDSSTAKPRNAK